MSGKDHFEKEPFDPDAYEAFKRAVASRGSRPSIPNDAGIEAPEEIAERGRAMFRRALMQADADDLQEDLRQMLEALGMSAHARPYSPHRVFQEALNEMKQQLAAVPRSAANTASPPIAKMLHDHPDFRMVPVRVLEEALKVICAGDHAGMTPQHSISIEIRHLISERLSDPRNDGQTGEPRS